jgi:hypothetical protein
MPRTDINNLPDDARIWIFGISPPLDDAQRDAVLETVDPFLDQWAAHNVAITSARTIIDGSFLVIAVDKQSETSGCSIDRMFGLLRQLEQRFSVQILEANRVFVRHGDGHVGALTRAEFRESADGHTIVVDPLVERLGDVRHGAWEKNAEDSWHARLLGAAG